MQFFRLHKFFKINYWLYSSIKNPHTLYYRYRKFIVQQCKYRQFDISAPICKVINNYTTTSIIIGLGVHVKQLPSFCSHSLLFSFLCMCGEAWTKEERREVGRKEPLKFTTYIYYMGVGRGYGLKAEGSLLSIHTWFYFPFYQVWQWCQT